MVKLENFSVFRRNEFKQSLCVNNNATQHFSISECAVTYGKFKGAPF